MSNYEQFDLFSGNFELDLPTEVFIAPKVLAEKPLKTTFEMKTNNFDVLRDIEPGSILYTSSPYRPTKLLVLENNNGKLKCKKMFDNDIYVADREKAEAAFEFDYKTETLFAVAEKDGLHFFSKNQSKPLRKVNSNSFTNYFAQFKDNDLFENLVVFRSVFSHRIDTITNYYKTDNPFISFFRRSKYYDNYATQIGYWDNEFTVSFDYRSDQWEFNYFGYEFSWSEEKVLGAYKKFISVFKTDDPDGAELSTLSDLHLIAFYAFQGYRVELDFLTFEWTFAHAASRKKMYVEKTDLFDPDEVIKKWTEFSTKKNVCNPALTRGTLFNDRFIDRYTGFSGFKPYLIPQNSIVSSETLFELTGYRYHAVLEDNGKQVRLASICPSFSLSKAKDSEIKFVDDAKEILLPRKLVTEALLIKNDGTTALCSIPFGTPDDKENNSDAIIDALENYHRSLSKLELLQLAALNIVASSNEVLQAIREKDIPMAISILKERNSSGGTSIIPSLFYENSSTGTKLRSYKTDFEISFTFKQLCEAYWAMQISIERFQPEDFTLPELMLFYRKKGHNLRLTGLPSFYHLDGKPFHTTKYNPTDYDQMMTLFSNTK